MRRSSLEPKSEECTRSISEARRGEARSRRSAYKQIEEPLLTDKDRHADASNKSSYKHWTNVELRFADSDALGHINNAVYATLFEAGRFSFFGQGFKLANESERFFTLARLTIDFLNEMYFPGTTEIGTRILSVGRSSLTLRQGIFIGSICHAISDNVMVLADAKQRRSTPLTDEILGLIEQLQRAKFK